MALKNPNIKEIEKPIKWEVVYEDDECIQIWKYNLKRQPNGPVEVETKWKKSFNPWGKKEKKTLGDLVKETKISTKKV